MGLLEKLFQQAIKRQVQAETERTLPAVKRQLFQLGMQQALISLYNQNLFRYINDGQVLIDEESFDYIERGYKSIGAVYECVDIIMKKVIACPRIVYRVKDQKEYKKWQTLSKNNGSPEAIAKSLLAKARALEEVNIPQIEKLLKKPNSRQNGDEMLQTLTGLYLLRGNSFLYGNGSANNIKAHKWSELFAFPTQMKIISGGPLQPIKEYFYSWFIDTPFPAEQIKHFKTFNPSWGIMGENLYGMPILRPYLYSLDIIKNADKQSDKQIKNGGKIGIISPKNKEDQLETEQKDQLNDSLRTAFASDEELARIIPGSIPLEFLEIGLSSQEMEVLKTGDVKSDDIYRAYHIPLQFRTQDTATYNNLPVANRQLIYNAVAPVTRVIEQGLTEFICEPYMKADGEEYIIHLDYTSLPELNDDMKAVAEWLDKCWDLTPNEKREIKGWGRSAQPGMDEIWVDKKLVRMSDVMAGKIDQSSGATPAAEGSSTAVPAKSDTPWLIEK